MTDPETEAEHDVPIAVMDFPVYEDEPDPLDQHDEGIRQEGYPQENARLFSLTPSNIRVMREALSCCRDGDPQAAARALTAALADVDAVDNLRDRRLDIPTPAELTVTTRPEPATRDEKTLAFRRARLNPAGRLEELAEEGGLPFDGSGAGVEPHVTLRTRTTHEKGALCRLLVVAHQTHLTPHLKIEDVSAEDRELILGLGLGEEIFEADRV